MWHVLAADLGGSRLRTAVVSQSGRILVRSERPTEPEEGPNALVARLVDALTAARRAVPASIGSSLRGAVIAGPGPLSPATGTLLDPILPFDRRYDRLALGDLVSARIGLPVRIERDTVVAALSEQRFGIAKGVDDFVYLTVSTGIGAAIVANASILRGADGLAGEIGHVAVTEADDPCPCGARGHLEAIAGGHAMARLAERAVALGLSPGLASLKRQLGGAPLGAREIAVAAEVGDPVATAIRDRADHAVAVAISGLVNVFNPSLVVLGGSIALAGGSRYIASIRTAVDADSIRSAASRVSIVLARAGQDAGLTGAAAVATLRLSQPSSTEETG